MSVRTAKVSGRPGEKEKAITVNAPGMIPASILYKTFIFCLTAFAHYPNPALDYKYQLTAR